MTLVRKSWGENYRASTREWYLLTRWCCTELGIPGEQGDWNFVTTNDYTDFYFKDPKMAELFILKWM